jgi:hypothetical protein
MRQREHDMQIITLQRPSLHPLFPERSAGTAADTAASQAARIDPDLITTTRLAVHPVAAQPAGAALE